MGCGWFTKLGSVTSTRLARICRQIRKPHSVINTMSNKRVKNDQGWFVPRTPENRLPPPRPSTGSVASDAAAGIMEMWYFQEAKAWERVAGERKVEVERLEGELTTNIGRAVHAERRMARYREANRVIIGSAQAMRDELQFKTNLIEEIFARFPEVLHEYEWLNAAEALDEEETETEDELWEPEM